MDIKVSCQRIGNGARELLEILCLDIAADFLDESYLVLVYVDNEILGLIREQILDNVERRGNVLDEVAPVEFLVVALLDIAQRHAADIRIFACKLIFAVDENSILCLHMRAERTVGAAV